MSAAAAREARRKAILGRGTDRLAKLTSTARGDDATYMRDEPPVPKTSTNLFLGEETNMPTPPTRPSPSPSPSPQSQSPERSRRTSGVHNAAETTERPKIDPSVWSEEQQAHLMQTLMGGTRPPRPPGLPQPRHGAHEPQPSDDLLANMLASLQNQGQAGKAPAVELAPPTRLQKLMPLVHLGTLWCLLAYFVVYKEPQMYKEQNNGRDYGIWSRWAELGRRDPTAGLVTSWSVHLVPFFWAFTTLQIVLHSLRIFSGFDTVQPPTIVALVLPHLPPRLQSIIVNTLKYLQMGSLFLDDVAGLIVGIGFIIFFSDWFVRS